MKRSFEEQIVESGIFSGNIFVFPEKKQNEYLKGTIIKHELLRPLINLKFPDVGNVTATIYFPCSTKHLLERHSRQTIHALDMIYSMLLARRAIVTLKVLDGEYQKHLVDSGVMPDALACMFFDDYAMLPTHVKSKLLPVNPLTYLQTELN